MTRERFERDTRERKFVSDLIVTIPDGFHQSYFLNKIEKLYNQDGFLSRNSYDELNTRLLNLGNPVELTKAEFLASFDAILNTYAFLKILSLVPRHFFIFAPPRDFQPIEINSTKEPLSIRGKSLSRD
jgi:hypothetical protein